MIKRAMIEKYSRVVPTKRGLEKLAQEVDAFRNRSSDGDCRLTWLIDAWSGGAGSQELADLIEGHLGEHYLELEEAFRRIEAPHCLEYLRKARAICGDGILGGERIRADTVEKHYPAIYALFKEYKTLISEEASMRYFAYMLARPEKK